MYFVNLCFIKNTPLTNLFQRYSGLVITHKIKENVEDELIRITLPHKTTQFIERNKVKRLIKEKEKLIKEHHGKILISCKKSKFNHFKGQTYSNFSPEHLASSSWKNRKYNGDYFTILAHHGNQAFKDCDVESFEQLQISSIFVNRLKEQNIKVPTTIQSKVIKELLVGKSVLCAAETGNGKTLSFLLPMLEKALQRKKLLKSCSNLNQPVGIIISPSRELADQIFTVAKEFANDANLNIDLKCGGNKTQKILREMEVKPIDILITTPGILSKLLTNKFYNLSQLSLVVLDEADSLLDDSFCELLLRIIRKLKITHEKLDIKENDHTEGVDNSNVIQFALVGATMPMGLANKLQETLPLDCIEVVTTKELHHILPNVSQKYLRIGNSKKFDNLLELIKCNVKRNLPSLIFCNRPEIVHFIEKSFLENEINCISLHANMSAQKREGRFKKFQNGETNVLVCTDIASRGLDTIRVQHIINYEFPHFISDYIHRVGRVGRLGSPRACFVLNYITHPWDVELLWKIEMSMRLNKDLPNVNANIKRKLVANAIQKLQQEQNQTEI